MNAICYLASSDEGRYVIPGVAPGIYDVYASAVGFSRFLIAADLKIHKQPASLDGHVQLTLITVDNAALRLSGEQQILSTSPERLVGSNVAKFFFRFDTVLGQVLVG